MASGILFVLRTVSSTEPIVDLRVLADRDFALGCVLSFILGVGLYGSIYLMPVFLAFVRKHSAFEIGQTMVVMGAAQLVVAPLAVLLERRASARLLTTVGFGLFAVGLASSALQTRATDFDEMLVPRSCAARRSCFVCCHRYGWRLGTCAQRRCRTPAGFSICCATSVVPLGWL